MLFFREIDNQKKTIFSKNHDGEDMCICLLICIHSAVFLCQTQFLKKNLEALTACIDF